MSPVLALGVVGAVGGGISAIMRNKQQQNAANSAQRQQQAAQQQDMMARQQQDALMQQKQQNDQMQLEKAKKLTDAYKVPNAGSLGTSATTYTSPIGDPTDPMLSKKTLLGN